MKQVLSADKARVLGTWSDGSAAVTVHDHGKGRAFAAGTLAGASYIKTGLRRVPYARGGRHTVYNPTGFDPAATRLVRLAVDAARPVQAVVCGDPGVEAVVIDHKAGTLVTLVNWTNGAVKDLSVRVRLPAAPRSVRSVVGQKAVPFAHKDGVVTFKVSLDEGDFILLAK
jgi:hypothetical protein